MKNKKLLHSNHDGFEFKTKKELVKHLMDEFDEKAMIVDMIVDQLEDLGVKNPYQ